MATIKEVAKMAGVASSTVSLVINGKENVSESTRKKVVEAIKKLNYFKHGAASEMKLKSVQTIGVIVHDMSNPYFADLLLGIESVTRSHHCDLIICSSLGGDNSTANRYIREKRLDAAIVISQDMREDILVEAAADGLPMVVMERKLNSKHVVNVMIDDAHGGYLATKYLIDQGHQTIAYISGPLSSDCNLERYLGYLKALDEAGLMERTEWRLAGQFQKEGGYNAAKKMMETELPSAVFFANDEMAVGGLEAFRENNIKVPEQISVIGFDNIDLSQYTIPALTTFRQPKMDAGQLAGLLIIQKLNGEYVNSVYTLNIQCVERDSVSSNFG